MTRGGLPLFDDEPAPRPPDPRTMTDRGGAEASAQAAREVLADGTVTRQGRIVLEVLRANPGLTAAELHDLTGLEELQQTRRRLTELKLAGLAARGSSRSCRIRRRTAHTWTANPVGA